MGKTPLHYAVENNFIELLQILIAKGADVNVKDINYQNIRVLLLITKIKKK